MKHLIDAIAAKAERRCPGALALIGLYGSQLTGDTHEKSDLDLMILVNNHRGYALAECFIDESRGIGYDLYCTTWEMLEDDARCGHPYLTKLLDSKILYCAGDAYLARLEEIRQRAWQRLAAPMDEKNWEPIGAILQNAKLSLADALLAESLPQARYAAANTINQLQNAVMLLNRRYFRFGTKRVYEELSALEMLPPEFVSQIDGVVRADSLDALKKQVLTLVKGAAAFLEAHCPREEKPAPTPAILTGSYEEICSNWKNKLKVAEELKKPYVAFMSMAATQGMLKELAELCRIEPLNVLNVYDPRDLNATREGYNRLLEKYLREYEKIGLPIRAYESMDVFLQSYRHG